MPSNWPESALAARIVFAYNNGALGERLQRLK